MCGAGCFLFSFLFCNGDDKEALFKVALRARARGGSIRLRYGACEPCAPLFTKTAKLCVCSRYVE